MKKTTARFAMALVVVVSLDLLLGSTGSLAATLDVKQIAQTVSQGIGTISRSGEGKRGAAILILEETHTSRPGQLEQAIALVRLHDQFGLRDIALEGYLKERPAIKTEWFAKAGRGLAPTERTAVAAQMLRDGEISAAEFMKLAYDDITLHPIETVAQHAVELQGDAAAVTITYLLKIAQTSLRENHVPTLQRLQSQIQSAASEQKKEKVKEMFDFILSVDPWTKERGAALTDTNRLNSLTAEKMLAEVEELDQRARKAGVELDAKEKQAMSESLRFWRGRAAASRTMITEAGRIADRPGVRLVALNIGAAHTDGMAAMLASEQRPYAVIRTLALNDRMTTSRAEMDALDRKYKGLSVFNEGVTKQLLDAFPVRTQKKPEPVLNQPWFQAKAELHLFTSRITHRVFPATGGGGGPRLPAGNPPFGFGDDDLRGQWIYIDPKRISIVGDDDTGKSKAVLFPVVLNPNDAGRRQELWVKAGFDPAFALPVPSAERKAVEEMLKRHLEDIRKEDEAAKKREESLDLKEKTEIPRKAEDAKGRIQIDMETRAAIATSMADVTRIPVTSI